MKHVIKRRGHKEEYDERKTYTSSYAACLNAHISKEKAEKISEKVTNEVSKWIEYEKEVTSDILFQKITEVLRKLDQDAAFMFETHRDLS